MVKPSEVPATMPEMDMLNAQQEAAIEEFLAKVDERYRGEVPYCIARENTHERRRMFGYKTLKARKWKVAHALEMVEKTVAFRAQHGIDKWKLFPCAFPLRGFEEEKLCSMLTELPGGAHLFPREGVTEVDRCYRALQSSYVNVYHYWDKGGHPVLYDCCGQADVTEILREVARITPLGKSLVDVIVPYHLYMNEVQYYLVRYGDKLLKETGGQALMGITVIIDMEGISFKVVQKRFIQIIRAIFDIDQAYYPEMLHRLFILNAPSFFRMVYGLVKGSLDENTRSKVVLSTDKKEGEEILKRVIEEDKIPRALGGTCSCDGGCLPRYAKPNGGSHCGTNEVDTHISPDDGPTETVGISKGKQFVRICELDSGDHFTWEFVVDGMHEVLFSVAFSPSVEVQSGSRSSACGNGVVAPSATTTATSVSVPNPASRCTSKESRDNRTVLIIKDGKVPLDADSFVATEQGTLTLTWSNKAAWLHARQVHFRVWHHKCTL
nr:unnamed protein product [Leishmania braziliensis]